MRKPGRPPAPRRKLNPELARKAIEATYGHRPSWLLATLCGFSAASDFSEVIHAERVRETPLMVERLQRLAQILDFPPDEVFLPEAEERP